MVVAQHLDVARHSAAAKAVRLERGKLRVFINNNPADIGRVLKHR